MENFKPTHFIEQYNYKEAPGYSHTKIQLISELPLYLGMTAQHPFLKTVAIFKIQMKEE